MVKLHPLRVLVTMEQYGLVSNHEGRHSLCVSTLHMLPTDAAYAKA